MAHLVPKPKRSLPDAPITTRVTPADERSVKFRPHTAPISEIAGPASKKNSLLVRVPSSDRTQHPSSPKGLTRSVSRDVPAALGPVDRPASSDANPVGFLSEDKGEAGKEDGIITDITASDSFDQAMTQERVLSAERKKSRSRKSSAGASRGGSASPSRPASGLNALRPVSSVKRPVSGASRPVSSGVRVHDAAAQSVLPVAAGVSSLDASTSEPSGSVASSRPTSASVDSSGAFNPLCPSVFAASLMSDHSALLRRQSVSSSTDFNAMFGVPDDNRPLSPVQENTESSVASAARSVSVKRQTSGGFRLQRDSSNVSRLSSKSSSFSSLPSVDNAGPKMKQKSVSMKKF